MTPLEGRSLLKGGILLLVLSVIRVGMDRSLAPEPAGTGGESGLPRLLEESREERIDRERRSAPLGQGEKLDPNRSLEEDLDRLPGIGPATARAWVENRAKEGGFAAPEDLLRVGGIGPSTLAKIRGHLDFSKGIPVDLRGKGGSGSSGGSLPGGAATPRVLHRPDSTDQEPHRVDVNRAGSEELQSLPGIGPALAERILESRRREGPFRSTDDLLRVPGIGPSTLARIRGQLLPTGGHL